MQNDTPKIVGAFVISAIIFAGAYAVLAGNATNDEPTSAVVVTTQTAAPEEQTTPTTQTTEEQPVATPPAESATTAQTYVDGTYSASKTYTVPEGHTETISVQVTVNGDTVSGLQVDAVPSNGESAEYQGPFNDRIVGEVEGQDLDNADVSRLAGASLTSRAFNDLLEAIRSEARG